MKITKHNIFKAVLMMAFFLVLTCCKETEDDPGMPITINASAGIDQSVEPTDMVTLDASGSSASGGASINYLWAFNSRPNGSNAQLNDINASSPTFIADVEGDYVLMLTVSSGNESATDMLVVSSIEPEFMQSDQMGRPAINTVFVNTDSKDEFNVTTPVNMGPAFSDLFELRLMALNPGYSTNALGWDAATMAGALSTDVLNLDLTNTSSFGSLNGRKLSDDVVTTELTLIFGGPDGLENPGLSDDHVDGNDVAFSTEFPYLAGPH